MSLQALEPASLIPLQLLKSRGTKCIMVRAKGQYTYRFLKVYFVRELILKLKYFLKVGDPKQLPATVLSNVASKFMYECSMFERLQRAGHPVIMLTEQVTYVQLLIPFCSV